MNAKTIFRITFFCHETQYEIYARQIAESEMFGFLEVQEFVFGEHTTVVVDPSEERLKNEFSDVKRTYIPMHSIVRIDEVTKEGVSKAVDTKENKVSQFPSSHFTRKRDES